MVIKNVVGNGTKFCRFDLNYTGTYTRRLPRKALQDSAQPCVCVVVTLAAVVGFGVVVTGFVVAVVEVIDVVVRVAG